MPPKRPSVGTNKSTAGVSSLSKKANAPGARARKQGTIKEQLGAEGGGVDHDGNQPTPDPEIQVTSKRRLAPKQKVPA